MNAALVTRMRWLQFLFWLGCWVALDWTLRPYDLLAGVVSAACVVAATDAVARRARLRFTLERGWWRHLLGVPRQVAADTGTVLLEALRRIGGGAARSALHDVAFDPRGPDTDTAARRAVLTAAITVSPNSILCRIEPPAGAILVHSFTASVGEVRDPRWPLLS